MIFQSSVRTTTCFVTPFNPRTEISSFADRIIARRPISAPSKRKMWSFRKIGEKRPRPRTDSSRFARTISSKPASSAAETIDRTSSLSSWGKAPTHTRRSRASPAIDLVDRGPIENHAGDRPRHADRILRLEDVPPHRDANGATGERSFDHLECRPIRVQFRPSRDDDGDGTSPDDLLECLRCPGVKRLHDISAEFRADTGHVLHDIDIVRVLDLRPARIHNREEGEGEKLACRRGRREVFYYSVVVLAAKIHMDAHRVGAVRDRLIHL